MNRRDFIIGAGASSLLLSSPAQALTRVKFSTSDKKKKEVMEEARKLIGLSEKRKKDRQVLTSYFYEHLGIKIDPRQTAWCAAYVDSVLAACDLEPLQSLWARDFSKYGNETKEPEFGDLVVLRRGKGFGHVGFFVQKHPEHKGFITLLNGNSNSQVKFSNWNARSLIAYRSIV